MSHVLLLASNDGGEIDIVNGVTTMSAGLETAVYLSLFGVNSDVEYWGNYLTDKPEEKLQGKTDRFLTGLPVSSGYINEIKRVVNEDLTWLIDIGIATEIEVTVTIPTMNTYHITVDILGEDSNESIYNINWQVSMN